MGAKLSARPSRDLTSVHEMQRVLTLLHGYSNVGQGLDAVGCVGAYVQAMKGLPSDAAALCFTERGLLEYHGVLGRALLQWQRVWF